MKDISFSRFEKSVEKSLPIKKVVIIKEDPSVLTTKLGLNNIAQMKRAMFILKMTSRCNM